RRQQVPPMYSAVKVKGVPLYKAARAGRTVSRSPREFTVRSLEILSIGPMPEGTAHLPTLDVTFDVVCSKGTYVRTLCADIGELLGVGGHLASVQRRGAEAGPPWHHDQTGEGSGMIHYEGGQSAWR